MWVALTLCVLASLSLRDELRSTRQAWARATLERDLALTLTRSTAAPFVPGGDEVFTLTLENRSARERHAVVLPGDGSATGLREPRVWYTVDRRDGFDAPWRPAQAGTVYVCGNYNPSWDVVTLEPGGRVALPWSGLGWHWDVEGATDVRIVAHYAFNGGLRGAEPVLMHQQPSFELASSALELPIRSRR